MTVPKVIFYCCCFDGPETRMFHFVNCLLPRLPSPCVSSSPPTPAPLVGGINTQGEEARKGIEDVQIEKREEGLESSS